VLVVAAERRAAPVATAAELTTGHGAAAVVVGLGVGLARLLGSASLTVDFVDHFRSEGAEFDYHWEERWVREEGYLKIVPRAVEAALADSDVAVSDVNHFCLPCPLPGVDRQDRQDRQDRISDSLAAGCGDTGAAHPLVMLVRAPDETRPGDRILVASFGQGADLFVFEATEAIVDYQKRRTGIGKWLDRGIRSEADKGTALTAMYRHRDLLTGLVGGRCDRSGTYQITRLRICVNPDCRAIDSQVPHSFAESRARVGSWSANLTYAPDPPAYSGMVDFAEGGRLMIDFTDLGKDGVRVGTPMRMVFRVKDHDRARGFTRYFWKAAPVEPEEA